MAFGGSKMSVFAALVLGVLLVALTGCEDQQARASAGEAAKQVDALKAQISALETKADETAKRVQALQDKMVGALNDRMEKINDQVASSTKNFLDTVGKDAEKTRKTATDIAEATKSDFDRQLTSAKTTLAADIQKIREDNKAQLDELKAFMDNQLKELYPYAYQPRRLPAETEAAK